MAEELGKIEKPEARQFREKRKEKLFLKKDGGELDAITAATISSRAVVNGVREGIEKYAQQLVEEEE